jgi:hypothetical protein
MTALARPESAAAEKPVGLSRGRHIAVDAIIVVAAVLTFVSALTLWTKRQLLDNAAWNHASAQVIQDPRVRASVSTYLVNQLYQNVNVAQELEGNLPPSLKRLAEPLATALREPLQRTAEAILARPRVQKLWITTTAVAHEKLVNVLENKTGHGISTGNGNVTIDLQQLLTELGADVGLPASIIEKIPAGAGTITLMKSDQLATAQKGVRAVKVLSLWLTVIVFGLYALAIFLARGARRRALRNVGWALVVVGLLVLLARRVIGNYVINKLASPDYKGTVHDVWLIGTHILGQIGAAAVLYGLVAIAGAVFAGPTHWATRLRGFVAPTLNRRPGLVALGIGVLYLWIVQAGPTYALRTWWGVLVFAALIAGGFVALRRQTLAEFPPSAPPKAPSEPAAS